MHQRIRFLFLEDINPKMTQSTNTQFPPGPSFYEYMWTYFQERCDFLRLTQHLANKYGDIVHVQVGSRHHYFINHPDHIEKILLAGYKIKVARPRPLRLSLGNGLITSQGQCHRKMRRHMQPFFQKHAILDESEMIVELTNQISSQWKEGEARDIAKDITYLVFLVITRILFGSRLSDEKTLRKIGEAFKIVHEYSHQSLACHIHLWLSRDWPWLGKFTRATQAREFVDNIILEQIKERRAEGNFDGPDLLSALLKIQASNENEESFSDTQIRDEIFTLYIAGHETTANFIAWAWYLISQHPNVEAKLHEEVDRVLAERMPGADDIGNLPYLRMICLESLRLYPSVWTIARTPADDDFQVGDYKIPRKSAMLISPYVTQRNKRYYPDPEKFIPERFTPEEASKRPRCSYFPFAIGNRSCMGEQMTWVESMLIISTIARQWRFELVPDHPIEMQAMISLKPKHGIKMVLHSRK